MDNQLITEIELLGLFNLDSVQEGLKVHHDAEPEKVAAMSRLFEKGFVSQVDGGYLTDRGIEAAEHVGRVVSLLKS
ncbi:TIGR02647 family protein [Aliikangiella sp. G2MR2-5]|uniref:TIGR02647 family protein n=1 Tax=Aliikangiella sp. G2MR2-5 TaxID=2788943 RepID=UPI0018ABB2DA|nr:TIGR02647 family protein [Aliikangiella sp. G2MR2-5]